MKIYLAHNGFFVVDNGSSQKTLAHDPGTPLVLNKVGSQVWGYYQGQLIFKEDYANIQKQDGSAAGATIDLVITYIQNLWTVLES